MSIITKKYFALFGVFAVAISIFMMSPSQNQNTPSQETLVIGLQSGYPPFEYMDSDGKIVGFDVDIAQQIANQLGKTLVIKDMEFEAVLLSLKQKKIDLILSGMNITPSRLKEINMVPYHGEAATSFSLLFWGKIPEGVQTLSDIAKHSNPTVSVQSGAVSEIFMQRFPSIKTKSFDGALTPLMDVKYGKSLACLVENDVGEYLKSQHPEIQILNVPLPIEDRIMGFGIGIKKDNQEMVEQVNAIIQKLKSSGELKKLEDKWFKGVV